MVGLICLLATQRPEAISITPAGLDYKEPQVAIEDDGHVYVAYGLGNAIYVSISKDRGAKFSQPILVAEAGKLSLGMRRGPRITAHNGIVTISATYGRQGKGQDGDLVAFRSANYGETWSGAARVNDIEGAAREGLHAMGVSPDGTVACTWLDLRSKGTKLYLATSKDGGSTWSKNRLVYESPSGSVCECCHPSLIFDRFGKLIVMFRNSLNGARDMFVTSSKDNGQTFSPAAKLGNGTWMLNACPMDGGMLATNVDDRVQTVWRREDQVYGCLAGAAETSMGLGRQPWLAAGPKGPYRIWSSGQGIIFAGPQSNPVILSSQGTDPVVSSSPDRRIVIGAWANGGIQITRLAP